MSMIHASAPRPRDRRWEGRKVVKPNVGTVVWGGVGCVGVGSVCGSQTWERAAKTGGGEAGWQEGLGGGGGVVRPGGPGPSVPWP